MSAVLALKFKNYLIWHFKHSSTESKYHIAESFSVHFALELNTLMLCKSQSAWNLDIRQC